MDEISERQTELLTEKPIAMKQYIKPSIKVRELHTRQIIATSLPIGGGNVNPGQGDGENDFSHGRRGTWGNLWYDGSEE